MAGKDNGIVKGQTLRDLSERVITCKSGFRYRIRCLTTLEVIELRGALPDVSAIPLTDGAQEAMAKRPQSAGQISDMATIAQKSVALALVEPKVGDGQDDIEIRHVPPSDLTELFHAVFDLYGLNREAAVKVVPLSDASVS